MTILLLFLSLPLLISVRESLFHSHSSNAFRLYFSHMLNKSQSSIRLLFAFEYLAVRKKIHFEWIFSDEILNETKKKSTAKFVFILSSSNDWLSEGTPNKWSKWTHFYAFHVRNLQRKRFAFENMSHFFFWWHNKTSNDKISL